MRKSVFWIIMLAIVAGVLVVIFASPRSPLNRHSSAPTVVGMPVATAANYESQGGLVLPLVQLEGQWFNKTNDLAFIATISGQDIKIDMMNVDGTSSIYWHGTFKTADSVGSKIVSDKTEADDEIVLSQDATKEFTVQEDSLTFKFSALGFSKNVALTR